MRWMYSLFYYLALPAILVRLLMRSRKNRDYRLRWRERFAFIAPLQRANIIWVHAVSVGESIAAVPLIKGLLQRYPHHSLTVTTTTPTGSQFILQTFKDSIHHVYFPFDTPTCIHRFLSRIHPVIAIIMETEMWPNMYAACLKKNIPIVIANGRLSERSSKRYLHIQSLTKKMLQACRTVMVQSALDGERFLQLGLDEKKLMVSGNIKFDMQISSDDVSKGLALKTTMANRLVWVAASTHDGEETIVLDAFNRLRQKIKDMMLIVVPRHVERFDVVEKLCVERGYNVVRYLTNPEITDATDILLMDTIGDLRMVYAASDIAFVGGSLVDVGGHNLIEPAIMGLPIVTGPHLHNFTEISRLLMKARALKVITDIDELVAQVMALCESKTLRETVGQYAMQAVRENQGALERHFEVINSVL